MPYHHLGFREPESRAGQFMPDYLCPTHKQTGSWVLAQQIPCKCQPEVKVPESRALTLGCGLALQCERWRPGSADSLDYKQTPRRARYEHTAGLCTHTAEMLSIQREHMHIPVPRGACSHSTGYVEMKYVDVPKCAHCGQKAAKVYGRSRREKKTGWVIF